MQLYIRLYRELISFLRWRLPALVLLMVLVGLTEGLTVALLLPLLGQLGISYTTPPGPGGLILNGALAIIGPAGSPTGILVIVIAVALIQALLFIALNWWMAKAAQSYQRYRQTQLFHAFMCAKWE